MTLSERVYSINYFKAESIVELTWLPGTQGMTDQDFKEGLNVFAEAAIARKTSSSICVSLWVDHPPRSALGAMTSLFRNMRRLVLKKSPGFGPACLPTRQGRVLLISSAILRRAMRRSIGARRAADEQRLGPATTL